MILQFIHFDLYSVIKSDLNSFCGDVLFDSFNKTSRDENNVLDQIYESKHVLDIIERKKFKFLLEMFLMHPFE